MKFRFSFLIMLCIIPSAILVSSEGSDETLITDQALNNIGKMTSSLCSSLTLINCSEQFAHVFEHSEEIVKAIQSLNPYINNKNLSILGAFHNHPIAIKINSDLEAITLLLAAKESKDPEYKSKVLNILNKNLACDYSREIEHIIFEINTACDSFKEIAAAYKNRKAQLAKIESALLRHESENSFDPAQILQNLANSLVADDEKEQHAQLTELLKKQSSSIAPGTITSQKNARPLQRHLAFKKPNPNLNQGFLEE